MSEIHVEDAPRVSVVMAIRNEEIFIEETLESIVHQFGRGLAVAEIVLADGMSDDSTVDLATGLLADSGIEFKVVENSRRTAATGLNLAIKHSTGQFVARVDGHCTLPPGYVESALDALQDDTIGCVGGPVETIGIGWVGSAVASAMSSRMGVGDSSFRVGSRVCRCRYSTLPSFSSDCAASSRAIRRKTGSQSRR